MAYLNKAQLIGRVGKDPVVRYTKDGMAICSISVATVSTYTSQDGSVSATEWHNVVLLNKQAEIAGMYLKKGRQVFIEGRIKTKKYQDQQGVEKSKTEIYADNFQMLGKKDDQTEQE